MSVMRRSRKRAINKEEGEKTSEILKVYDVDPEVYARTTSIKADRTKGEIDGILAKFGVKDVWWRYDILHNDVFIKFLLSEKFGDKNQELTVSIEPPRIWHKDKHGETINWNVSMRNLYWYIYTHLSQAYVQQSSKFTEFLPNIINKDGRKLTEIMREQYQALPEIKEEKPILR
jgi:hypothetical protein